MPSALIARMPPRAPATPSGYTKVRPLGRGSYGTVFLVRTRGGDEAVMKEVSLKGLAPKEREATLNEVRVLRKMGHPHVISYRDSHQHGETLQICMEYAAGGDLALLVAATKKAGRRLEEAEVLRLLYQLSSALAYCHHGLKTLHRDLKPGNVFLSAKGDVKLGDFGLSKALAASAALAVTQCGTPLYMSPELCEGRPYDRGADVWALGCVLYELMALEPPWQAQMADGRMGLSELLRHIARTPVNVAPLRAHYSPDLCALLASLLAKPAASRPSLRDILATPLMRAAAPEGAGAPPAASTGDAAAAARRPMTPVAESPATTPATTPTTHRASRPTAAARPASGGSKPSIFAKGGSAPAAPPAADVRPATGGGLRARGGWGGADFGDRARLASPLVVTAGRAPVARPALAAVR